jgi:hypothetical protein
VLYKVSAPRAEAIFLPSRFWRTEDWSSSSTREKPGYIEDEVLYAAGFDEVNIHLFPPVRRVRVWTGPNTREFLADLAGSLPKICRAVIFLEDNARAQVEAFSPTIYHFDPGGFEPIPSNEYISREPQSAVACETISIGEALARWHIEVSYVKTLDGLVERLKRNDISFSEQTA